MKRSLLLLLALALSSVLHAQDHHIVLWDNTTAPTSNGLTGPETEPKPGQAANTQKAEMWIYMAGENATGQALVFFPGGGYSNLSMANGHTTARWFAAQGITAAVVKYRLPNGHSEVPRADADEALRVMRSMAAELNIDPAKVGVSGTSAGGYLAGSVGVLSEAKPDFMILFYPVISADLDKRHKGTFSQLLGAEQADKPAAQEFSLEKKVDTRTPPALLFHSDDDKVVPAVNSALLYQKLKQFGIKSTLHIYPSGGHGWGINPKFRYYDDWQRATLDWLSTL
ncbi:alpha/beta hydrolase [uncultured Alistipes sp.]|uniref:alpha/beta hydrolase n=1 Tax=uncultured Alistipes sp. TaxID=538949 RepID=UPI0025E58A0B|nr:alpha/beta hydrolase [uncultured Alistipes sp.]